jgi:uncharacterized membrane protein YuzA (DUF378 family)
LTIILIGVLLALATVFRIANQGKINVQKFLGYGFLNMYLVPMVFICFIQVVELIVLFIARSKVGYIMVGLIALLQIVIFFEYMTKQEIARVRMAFKEE